jgi:aminopeptidase N
VIANNAQIYQGGAQTLHNIRGVLGTRVFWAGIRLYYSRYQNGNARTDDFRYSMEEACRNAGDECPSDGKDLSWLFRELLNRGGVLQVQGAWRYDAATKQVQVTLNQTQKSGLYRMPIELAITLKETTETEGQPRRNETPEPQPVKHIQILRLDQQSQVFGFPVASEPISVALDPDSWVMMQATFERK